MSQRHPGLPLTFFVVLIGFLGLVGLALDSTTIWAAPGSQGTVPTPRKPTPTATATSIVQCTHCTPPPPPVTITPPGPCHLGEPGGTCVAAGKTISVPVGAVISGTILTINGPLPQPPCPPTPAGQIFLDHCFQITWTGPNGQAVTFAKPIIDCLTYDSGDVALAGGNPANLLIGFVFDPQTNTWVLIKPFVDAANSRVCASVDRIFYWQALFAPQPVLPTTGGEPGADFPVAPLVFGMLALALGWRLSRIRRKSVSIVKRTD